MRFDGASDERSAGDLRLAKGETRLPEETPWTAVVEDVLGEADELVLLGRSPRGLTSGGDEQERKEDDPAATGHGARRAERRAEATTGNAQRLCRG